jgi:hypothetical protein
MIENEGKGFFSQEKTEAEVVVVYGISPPFEVGSSSLRIE